MKYYFLFTLLYCSGLFAYELVFIQGISDSKRTFITRNGKKQGIFEGKKATFTSNNVSIIANAIKVTGEFTQWKIENDRTPMPFGKDEIVTMYDAKEYLWTLNPELIKSKYIKSQIFVPRYAIETSLSVSRGLSESVSNADPSITERGGLQYEGFLQKEFNKNYTIAIGIRYTDEIVNLEEASLRHRRLLGMLEARYYFRSNPDFHNMKIGLALGFGLGQSHTQTSGQATSGTSAVLPSLRAIFNFPINKKYDFAMYGAIESVQTRESLEDTTIQTTNLVNSKTGITLRRYF